MEPRDQARLCAAWFVMGLQGAERDQIAINKFGQLTVASEPINQINQNRVGVLVQILLDAAGLHTDPGISTRLSNNKAHRATTLWVAKQLDLGGGLFALVLEFLHLIGDLDG